MAYICTVCKTPTPREGYCVTCGWVKTSIIKANGQIFNPDRNEYTLGKHDLGEGSVAFFTEDTQHITGGRYYSWWLATALQEAGFKVTIYTNREPLFLSDFLDFGYCQPEVRIVPTFDNLDVDADIYVGSPVMGSMAAIKLAERYGRKAYVEVFDPFPMMEKYRGKHSWPGWEWLIQQMSKNFVNIVSLCNSANPYIYGWLKKRKDQVFEVYPCINDRALKAAKKRSTKNWVTFVSRLDSHKKLGHVLNAVRATDCELHVITSIDGIGFDDLVRVHGMENRVVMHNFVSDVEKFEIIKQSRAMINGAIFEGFGMWLAEGISAGIPVVCYDYPTFHEIHESAGSPKNVYFADWNDSDDLMRKLQKALIEGKSIRKPSSIFYFDEMVNRVKQVIRSDIRVGVIQIALNEQEFIGASLRSIIKQDAVKKVAVVEGAVSLFSHAASKDGLSVDETAGEVVKVLSEQNGEKIVFDRYGWAGNKSELRNRAIDLVGDVDYILVLDADEVWKKEDFDKLMDYVKKNRDAAIMWPKALHFWKQKDLLATGGQWDAPLFRFFKYKDKSLRFNRHELPPENSEGVSVRQMGVELFLDDVFFYHYGAMKPENRIKEKLEFYSKRDKHLHVKNTWSEWKPGDETQWTHGGGTASPFSGEHPVEVGGLI